MNWREVFQWDGSWREIYIHDTSLDDWQRFLEFLRQFSETQVSFRWTDNDKDVPLPGNASAFFERSRDATPLLSVNLEGVLLCCHFSSIEWLELTVDPREIETEADANRVFAFMAELAKSLRKKVDLTPEGLPQWVLYTSAIPADEDRAQTEQ